MGGKEGDDEARRFITLVDVWYESRGLLLLLVEGDVMPHDLFLWSKEEDGGEELKEAMGSDATHSQLTDHARDDDTGELEWCSGLPSASALEEGRSLAVMNVGGSSGRHVTLLQGQGVGKGLDSQVVEWSGTGRPGVSLAQQQRSATAGEVSSFTQRASTRTVSRLLQMTGAEWLDVWARSQGKGMLRQLGR